MFIIPFHPDHLAGLRLVEEEQFFAGTFNNEVTRRAFFNQLSFSLCDDGKIYGSYGVIPIWPGRGLIWLVVDKDIGPKRFAYMIRTGADSMEKLFDNGFYRLEAYVQSDYPKASRLASLFKFEKEGLMKRLDGEHDYFLYARGKI